MTKRLAAITVLSIALVPTMKAQNNDALSKRVCPSGEVLPSGNLSGLTDAQLRDFCYNPCSIGWTWNDGTDGRYRALREVQCGYWGPSGQRIAANESAAAASSGKRRTTSTKEIPFRNHLPGPFCGIKDLQSTRIIVP